MLNSVVSQRTLAAAVLASIGLFLTGCQSSTYGDFAADITNSTPQPLFAQVFAKSGDRAVLGASKRLGPGDRALLGPVSARVTDGAYLAIDTMPNPGRPVTVDLAPGSNFFQVQQDGTGTAGPLRIIPKQ